MISKYEENVVGYSSFSGNMASGARTPVTIATHKAAARVLGLSPLPTAAEVKNAYHNMAKRCHPDVALAGSASKAEAEARFMEIRAAYETLQRPTMSETARKLMTPDGRSHKDEIRRYHQNTGSTSIRVMTALLFGMTGYLAFTLHKKERFPHQRGFAIRDLWNARRW
jgi:hypothetical protein